MPGAGRAITPTAIRMIELSSELLVGQGLHRDVYQHPEDPDLCLKVRVDRDRINRGPQEEAREQGYYRLLQKRRVPWQGLPQFHGNVDTNLGPAAIFELIRDVDGSVSKNLEYYLADAAITEGHLNQLIFELNQLKLYLLRYNIITMSLKSKNIVFQQLDEQQWRCVIIDNIGNSDWIPLMTYVPLFGRIKIRRKWQDFKRRLKRMYPMNDAVLRLLRFI